MPTPVPLVHVTRGGLLESVHRGSLVVVREDEPVLVRGDAERPVFYRSASKPLQALPLVLSGAAEAFGLADAEIALAAGSHNGSPEHVAAARSLLAKAGIDEAALQCGGHWSTDAEALAWQRAEAREPLRVFSNCSGKHAGMLAVARHLGEPLATYRDPAHPLQREIRRILAALGGVAEASVAVGVDGCGAPAFAVPLVAMARSLARLGAPDAVPAPLASACRRVAAAMRAHPEMVAGARRFDTDLMRATGCRALCKAGAEGVHGVAVPERRLGLAVKVEDGSDRGYRAVVLALLRRWGLLSAEDHETLAARHAPAVLRNHAGESVGTLEVVLPEGGAAGNSPTGG